MMEGALVKSLDGLESHFDLSADFLFDVEEGDALVSAASSLCCCCCTSVSPVDPADTENRVNDLRSPKRFGREVVVLVEVAEEGGSRRAEVD
jgi:hypothetical protein